MNPSAILTLISDLYTQVSSQAEHIRKLEASLAEKDSAARTEG